jgi:hypothetical protein
MDVPTVFCSRRMELKLLHFLCFELSTLPFWQGQARIWPARYVWTSGRQLSDAVPQIADVIIEAHLASQVSRLRLPISRTLAQNMPETPETTVLCNIVQSIKWVWNRSCSFQQV